MGELTHDNILQLAKKYEKMKQSNLKIFNDYQALCTSSLTCDIPNITQNTVNITNQESAETEPRPKKRKYNNPTDMTWDELHEIILAKCQQDNEHRLKTYSDAIQTLQFAELYPKCLMQSERETFAKNVNGTNHATILLTKYTTICEEYLKRCKEKVGDRKISRGDGFSSTHTYASVYPCKWVESFLGYVDNHVGVHASFLENKLYRRIELPLMSYEPRVEKIYAVDLPYHMCRFLSSFGSVMFVPTPPDRDQFCCKYEKFSDSELLVHFSIKSNENETVCYRDFLKSPTEFCQNNSDFLNDSLCKTVRTLLMVHNNRRIKENKIFFSVLNNGDNKMYQLETVDTAANVAGSQIKFKKHLVSVPINVVSVFRAFILPNMEEYRIDRLHKLNMNSIDEFNNQNYEFIYSPFGKLLNFDQEATNDFYTLDTSLKTKTGLPQARHLHSSIPYMSCVVRLYSVLLQAAKAIAQVSDPVDQIKIESEHFVKNIIVHGNTIGSAPMIAFVPVFEAFPGLFYFSFLSEKIHQQQLEKNHDICDKIFDMFGKYVHFIPRLNKKGSKNTEEWVHDLILPEQIRYVSVENMVSLIDANKQHVRDITCSFLNKELFNYVATDREKLWTVFRTQIPEEHLLKDRVDTARVLYSGNHTAGIRAFFVTPISMGIKIEEIYSVKK